MGITLHGAHHVLHGDHIHAAGQDHPAAHGDGLGAQALVLLIPVAQGLDAAFPAAARGAARKLADGVEEAVSGILLPLRGLAAPGNDDARTQRGARAARDGGGQVHEGGDRTDYAIGVMHQADKLPEAGLPAQVERTVEGRMVVVGLADLDEEDVPAKVLYDGLHAGRRPPFRGEVALAPADNDPEARARAQGILNLGRPGAFLGAQVNIAFECALRDGPAQHGFKVHAIAVDEVVRKLVAVPDGRVVHLDLLTVLIRQLGDIGVVLPQRRARGTHVGDILARICGVQVAHRRRHHHDVTRT